jgi:serine/threonine-protein kinase
MSLSPGTRIGPYEILTPIGAGGMGEVYRARDTKLNRDVAIKVLSGRFAVDGARLARFRREAQVLASLQHPNIAAIYGLEESNGIVALALELVEGEDLAARLKRGAIPVDEAIAIAKQIAVGLEAAHEKGVVHRDLKPANVKLAKDGSVKILDFGLAKAYEAEPASEEELSQLPTRSPDMTEAGIVLGTAAYMSPEQARGKSVDKRADIWSFGVVVFEMLAGRGLFEGGTMSDVLASVLRQDIPWSALPAETPLNLRQLLRRCLECDPKERMRDIGEARIAIVSREEAAALPQRHVLPWVLAGGLASTVVVVLWAPWRLAPEPSRPVRLSVELGADASLNIDSGPAAILSPDGKLLVFSARRAAGEPPQLYTRRLEQLAANPLPGTEDGRDPFFSPEAEWIAFFAGGKLKKVAVAGGAAVTLCDSPNGRGGTWSEDGTIFFTPSSEPGVGLSRVSSAGGTAEVVTTPDLASGEGVHRWPQALPGGKAVLFTASLGPVYDDASIVVLSLPEGSKKVLHRGGYYARYLPSGHLVYIHEGTLFAAPIDLGRLELTGPPTPVIEGVTSNTRLSGGAQFATSERGTLVFLPGTTVSPDASIQWLDQDGKTEPLRAAAGAYFSLRLSPDGQKLAMTDGPNEDVWVYEWGPGTTTRLTTDPGRDVWPVWTPDGSRIVFSSTRADRAMLNLYWQRADGTGEAERLTESQHLQYPSSWHPSGKFLAFQEDKSQGNWDIWILPMEGDEASGWKPGKPTVFVNSTFSEAEAAFSPDGRWLAYQSAESGTVEVYVRPFPGPGGKWLVSSGGGLFPTWSQKRRELFYRTPRSILMFAPFAVEGDRFHPEKPRQWSKVPVLQRGPTRTFDLHPDGRRFAALTGPEQQAEAERNHVVFIENFFDELRRVSPADKR